MVSSRLNSNIIIIVEDDVACTRLHMFWNKVSDILMGTWFTLRLSHVHVDVTLPKGERADSLLTSPYIRFTNSISRTAVLRVADVLLQHLVSSAFAFIVCS